MSSIFPTPDDYAGRLAAAAGEGADPDARRAYAGGTGPLRRLRERDDEEPEEGYDENC